MAPGRADKILTELAEEAWGILDELSLNPEMAKSRIVLLANALTNLAVAHDS